MRFRPDPCGRILLFVVLRQAVRRGVPLGDALRSTAGETDVPADVLAAMAREIEDGHPLSEALERRTGYFPAPLPALVAAGERAARLDETLDRCVAYLRRRERTRSRVGAALVYPGLCLAMLAAVAVLHAALDPTGAFARLYPPYSTGDAPLAAVWLRWGLTAALAAGVATALVCRLRPDLRDRVRLDLPLTGRIHRLVATAGFTRALAAMLERGAPIDHAVESSLPCTGNRWVEARLRERLGAVRDGTGLARGLTLPGVFPPSLTWRLSAGEAHGDLGGALTAAADAYEDELDVRSGRLARLVEPIGIVAVGVVATAVLLWIKSDFAGTAVNYFDLGIRLGW